MEIHDQIYSAIKAWGGPEILAARIVYEWYPEMFSAAEFEDAKKTLLDAKIRLPDERLVLVNGSYIRKKKSFATEAQDKPVINRSEYTVSDILYIQENWPQKKAGEIASHLHRTPQSVNSFIQKFRDRFGFATKNKDYTKNDISYIKKNWPRKTADQIADELDRSSSSMESYIRQNRGKLGLKFKRQQQK